MRLKSDSVSVWFLSIIILIVSMVCIGGITRLTGSGLSITEWKPIMGAIPPLNAEEWDIAFKKYQSIPQFQILNSKMTVDEFKFIFFWEYLHRLVGRLIGLVILIPGIYFVIRKRFDRETRKQILIGFLLGGAQGFLGWFMVKSGLSELVYVSHLRLAAHLLLALTILSYWTVLYLRWMKKSAPAQQHPEARNIKIRKSIHGVAAVLLAQIFYGALVAGLKAGLTYNTFPTMNGEWIPASFLFLEPHWLNFFSNGAAVQFIHRWLAVILIVVAARAIFLSIKNSSLRIYAFTFGALLGAQFLLGVFTLIFHVPLLLASLHQLNACALVVCVTAWAFNEKHVH